MPATQHLRRSIVALFIAILIVAAGASAGRSVSAQTGKVTVTGILNIVYGDPLTLYSVTDAQDTSKKTQLLLDDKTWQKAGVSINDLNRTLVTVSGVTVGSGLRSAALSSDAIAVADIKPAGVSAAVSAAQPVSGGQAYINLLCRFQDIATEQHPPSWYDSLLGIGGNGTSVPSIDNYFRDSSFGTITLTGSLTTSAWRSLPHPMSYYGDGTNTNPNIQTNLHNMAQDCVNTWSDLSLAPYIGLNIVMNGAVFQTAWGGTDTLTLNGTSRTVGTTWYNVTYGEYFAVWCHEMGHAFGLAHSGSDTGVEYMDAYDIMGYSYYAAPAGQPYVYWGPNTIGYHKDKLGWIPAARKFTYSSGSTTVTLDPLGSIAGTNKLLAQIPFPGGPATHFYTVELRAKMGSYESQLPVPATGAVIIHEVDTTRRVPAWVQGNLAGGSGNFTSSAAYQWTAGETWTAPSGLAVVVNSVSSTSASVTIGSPPVITSLSPVSATVGSAALTLTVNGVNFTNGTTVRWGGSARTTTFVSSTQLTAAIPATDLASAATVPVTVYDSGSGLSSGAVNFSVKPPMTSTTFTNSSPVSIPDVSTANSLISVAGVSGALSQVTASFYITHTYDSDLAMTLVAPDNTRIPLATRRGGSGHDFGTSCAAPTTFDDGAATAISAGSAPFSGTYRPETALAGLNNKTGAAVNGTWTLEAVDNAGGDVGIIQCWSLVLSTPLVASTPTVTAVSPSSGPAAGGSSVTVTGTGFSTTPGGSTVKFGTTPATAVGGGTLTCTVTQCLVSSPAGTGTVDVTVTTSGGTSTTSAADQFTYSAVCQNGTKADITSPAGSSISTGTPTFQWGGGVCVTQYFLYVGSAAGQSDLFSVGPLAGTVTSQTVSPAIPLNGQAIYVRLWSLVNGSFQSVDHSYTMGACNNGAKADITSPAGSSISTGTPTFQWGGGVCVTQYFLYVGSAAGQADLFSSGALAGTVSSATVSPALPLNGQSIYVRLWSLVNGSFQAVDHSYLMGACANPSKADLTAPAGGSISTGTPTFQWGGGQCVTQYYLYIGNTLGQADLFNSGPLASTVSAATVSPAIPVDGRTIYVRLWSLVNGGFQAVDHSYIMGACANPAKADITIPAGGSITTGTPTFTWGGGSCVTQYYLYVGSAAGTNDLFSANALPAMTTQATVSPAIPLDGRTIYVRLWSLVNGGFQAVDHSYIMGACQNPSKADISSPLSSTLHGTSQVFQWSGGACVTQYYLYIGSSAGQTNLYNSGALAGTVSSQTVTLPANNAPVYLRLWSLVNGSWQSVDHNYVSAP